MTRISKLLWNMSYKMEDLRAEHHLSHVYLANPARKRIPPPVCNACGRLKSTWMSTLAEEWPFA